MEISANVSSWKMYRIKKMVNLGRFIIKMKGRKLYTIQRKIKKKRPKIKNLVKYKKKFINIRK